jgi:hypothetical protein
LENGEQCEAASRASRGVADLYANDQTAIPLTKVVSSSRKMRESDDRNLAVDSSPHYSFKIIGRILYSQLSLSCSPSLGVTCLWFCLTQRDHSEDPTKGP